METFKTIFSGRLEFGSQRSYEKVLKMYQHRVENYYKCDVLLNDEEIFTENSTALDVPRFIAHATKKSWNNTLNLLEYVAQYAIEGDVYAWMTENGKIIQHSIIEPKSEKTAVMAFMKGRELVEKEGKEQEAVAALSRAIEKFERHAKAYERRGYVNYQLHNFKDADYDYSKSIDINGNNPEPFLGRAMVRIHMDKLEDALSDLSNAIKRSIPLMPIYWRARRSKAEILLKLKDLEGAVKEMQLFVKRDFSQDPSNAKWKKNIYFNLGKALMEQAHYEEALEAFNSAASLEDNQFLSNAELLLHRGLALQKAGQQGFKKDWEDAAKQGSERAAELLQTAC